MPLCQIMSWCRQIRQKVDLLSSILLFYHTEQCVLSASHSSGDSVAQNWSKLSRSRSSKTRIHSWKRQGQNETESMDLSSRRLIQGGGGSFNSICCAQVTRQKEQKLVSTLARPEVQQAEFRTNCHPFLSNLDKSHLTLHPVRQPHQNDGSTSNQLPKHPRIRLPRVFRQNFHSLNFLFAAPADTVVRRNQRRS